MKASKRIQGVMNAQTHSNSHFGGGRCDYADLMENTEKRPTNSGF